MSQHIASLDTLKKTTDAVVEYALISLEPEFRCWEKAVNMEIAEFVRNTGGRNLDPSVFQSPGGDLSFLVKALCHARRTRWPDAEVLLLGLDVHREHDEIVFTFDLSWDEGETFQACEIVVDHGHGSPTQRN